MSKGIRSSILYRIARSGPGEAARRSYRWCNPPASSNSITGSNSGRRVRIQATLGIQGWDQFDSLIRDARREARAAGLAPRHVKRRSSLHRASSAGPRIQTTSTAWPCRTRRRVELADVRVAFLGDARGIAETVGHASSYTAVPSSPVLRMKQTTLRRRACDTQGCQYFEDTGHWHTLP
jgi:hypothetical protein